MNQTQDNQKSLKIMAIKHLPQVLLLALFLVFGFVNYTNAENPKLYVSNSILYYECPDGAIAAPENLNIDIASVKILNDNYFVDNNNVYTAWEDWHSHFCGFSEITGADPESFIVYSEYFQKDKNNVYTNSNYWGWGVPKKITDLNIDATTFEPLNGYYAKDKNKIYIFTFENNGKVKIVEGADANTFEVLSEDENYAMDKNNMYLNGKILSQQADKITNTSLYSNIKGRIILNVDSGGEAYYIHPQKHEMHFLSRPVVAFYVMREQGVGITNKDLEKIPVADNYCPAYSQNCDKPNANNIQFANQQKGKIFIQVEENGEAWYVNPVNSKRYYLGRPVDAFNVMRNLGLGISDNNFNSLIGKKSNQELLKELLSKNNDTNNYKIFSITKSPNSNNAAVLFGLERYKPSGIFININGKLYEESFQLRGALEHLYLENVEWSGNNLVFFDSVIDDEGGKTITHKQIPIK
ncbi:MAG: DKNYY domain-containing protein [bacterium]